MSSVEACELPEGALLSRYQRGDAYSDCFVAEVTGSVTHAQYIEAFCTTRLFKLERLLLSWFYARPSTDFEAAELAAGRLAAFAIWDVEGREPDQLLLSAFKGRTRSWLMSMPAENSKKTKLFFGSAVVPVVDSRSGEARMGFVFRALHGFHTRYAVALLSAAAARL